MLENAGPIEAFGRAASLCKKYRWRLIGLSTVMALCVFALSIPGFVIQSLFQEESPFWGMVLSEVWGALLMPLGSVYIVLYYFDLRCRKEGFDVAVLAQSFGIASESIPMVRSKRTGRYHIEGYFPDGVDKKAILERERMMNRARAANSNKRRPTLNTPGRRTGPRA